jgi:Phospholipase_D-nuclease N-terminal/Short C-terminal domain
MRLEARLNGGREMLATFGDGQVFWAFLMFFLWIIWIWLAITVFVDLFRSRDLSGFAKAAWVIGIILFPYIGVFVYLVVRGGKMHERALEAAQAQDTAFRKYVRETAGTAGDGPKPADELAKLEDLKRRGVISDDEFDKLKAKVVSG